MTKTGTFIVGGIIAYLVYAITKNTRFPTNSIIAPPTRTTGLTFRDPISGALGTSVLGTPISGTGAKASDYADEWGVIKLFADVEQKPVALSSSGQPLAVDPITGISNFAIGQATIVGMTQFGEPKQEAKDAGHRVRLRLEAKRQELKAITKSYRITYFDRDVYNQANKDKTLVEQEKNIARDVEQFRRPMADLALITML